MTYKCELKKIYINKIVSGSILIKFNTHNTSDSIGKNPCIEKTSNTKKSTNSNKKLKILCLWLVIQKVFSFSEDFWYHFIDYRISLAK